MQLNERATITLIIEGDQARNELGLLEGEAKKLERALKEAPKGTEEWAELYRELGKNKDAQKVLRDAVGITGLSMKQLKDEVKQLSKEIDNLTPGTEEFVTKSKRLADVKDRLSEVKTQASGLGDAMDNKLANPGLWGKIAGGVKTISTAFNAFLLLGIVQFVVDIGKAIFETTAKFEKYEKVLTTALGSEKLAKESMAAIKEMAQNSVFSVDELTEGYVKMVNRGMKPSKKEMVALTDLAASQGKTFDQLVEAALDAATGEMERLKEFGITAKKSGDNVTLSFKGVNQTVKNTPEAIQGAIVKFGEMNGVAGTNAKMMETLGGKFSNLGDSMDALYVGIGERLKPVFMALLTVVSTGVGWLIKIVEASDPVIQVFSDLFDMVGDLVGAFMDMIKNVMPQSIAGSNALGVAMKGIGLILRALITPIQIGIAAMMEMYQVMEGLILAGKAVVKVLSGDFGGAMLSFEQSKKSFSTVGDASAMAFSKIKKGWQDAMVNTPKETAADAVFAAKDTEKKRQDAMTDEQKKALIEQKKLADAARKKEGAEHDKQLKQAEADKAKHLKQVEADHKKHLEDVQKANEKALADLSKAEEERQENSIRDELERDLLKLRHKRNAELRSNAESLASTENKEKLQNGIFERYTAEEEKITQSHHEKEQKKNEEAALKRLNTIKEVAKLEQDAEMALLDYKELMARGNAKKLVEIAKERAETTLRVTLTRLKEEEAAERAKAAKDITDTELLDQTLEAIGKKYDNERTLAEAKKADEIAKIEHDLKEKKKAMWGNASSAFSALLKGDLNSFVEHSAKIFEGERQGWQKKLEGNLATYEAIGQMATQAAQFLAGLAQKRADKAIAEAMRTRDHNMAALQTELDQAKTDITNFTNEKKKIEEQTSERIQTIRETEKKRIDDLEKFYSDSTNARSTVDLTAEIARTNQLADTKIAEATRTYTAEVEKATQTKEARIQKANETRDAEIAAINARADVSTADKAAMIAAATAKANEEIRLATEESVEQIRLSGVTKDTKITDATTEKNTKISLLNALNAHDGETVRDMMARAEQQKADTIRLATETSTAEINRATQTKEARIQKATETRDAEIAAINARADISTADKAAMIVAATNKANEEIRLATEEANEQIRLSNEKKTQAITAATTETDEKKRLLQAYSVANDATTKQAIADAQKEADQKIAEAQKNRDAQIAAALEEKTKKIEAAEATRDAEIAAILKRSDISLKERDRLIAAAKDKQATEIKLATEEAEAKTKLSKEEADAKVKDATEEAAAKTKLLIELTTADKDRATELLQQSKDEAEQKVKDATDEKDRKLALVEAEKLKRIEHKRELDQNIEDEDRKARAIQATEKRKAWEAQKKADMAAALIAGALATLKALASGPFPLNIAFAAATAIATAVQVVLIKRQAAPDFAVGGVGRQRPINGEGGVDWNNVPAAFRRTFGNGGYVKNAGVLQGGRHGRIYGTGGIRMIDNQTGNDVGEAEGGEPFMILSRTTYANNRDVIDRLLHSSLYRGGQKIAYKNGGIGGSPYARTGRQIRFEDGGVGGGNSSTAEGEAAYQEAKKQGNEQLKLLEEIRDAVKNADTTNQSSLTALDKNMAGSVDRMGTQVGQLKGSINEVRASVDTGTGATREVKDAIYATNQAGRLDALISAISNLK